MHYGFENKRNNIAQDGSEPKPQLQTPSFFSGRLESQSPAWQPGPPWKRHRQRMEESLGALVRQGTFLLPAGCRGLNTCRASLGSLQPLCHPCPGARALSSHLAQCTQGCWDLLDHHFGKGYGLDPKQLQNGSRQHHLPELSAPAPHQQRQTTQGVWPGEGTNASARCWGFVPSLPAGRRQSLP